MAYHALLDYLVIALVKRFPQYRYTVRVSPSNDKHSLLSYRINLLIISLLSRDYLFTRIRLYAETIRTKILLFRKIGPRGESFKTLVVFARD